MKTYLTLLLCLLVCTGGRAQESLVSYRELVDNAQAANQADRPRKALKLYNEAFSISMQQVADLLRATIIAESIKNLDKAEEYFNYLFDHYPLETAITFLEGPEFGPNRSGPFYEMFIRRAAYGLGPERNGRVQLGRFDKVVHRYAMPNDRYILLVEVAHRSMIRKDYQRAIYYYELAFSMKKKSQLSLLRAAACYFHNNDQEIAATYLEEAFETFPIFALKIIRVMPGFQKSLAHPQFAALVGQEINRHFPKLDIQLVTEIDSLNALFLTHRSAEPASYDIAQIPTYNLMISEASIRAKQDQLDNIISIRIDSFLSTNGYPAIHLVADRLIEFDRLLYAVHPSVILKHWELILQQSATEQLSAFRVQWALANRYDSNCFRRGMKQKFGSIWFVPASLKGKGIAIWPVEQPAEIDKRRAGIGLETIKAYTKGRRINFSIKAQQSIGSLAPEVRDEVHAKGHSFKEIGGFPYDYQ